MIWKYKTHRRKFQNFMHLRVCMCVCVCVFVNNLMYSSSLFNNFFFYISFLLILWKNKSWIDHNQKQTLFSSTFPMLLSSSKWKLNPNEIFFFNKKKEKEEKKKKKQRIHVKLPIIPKIKATRKSSHEELKFPLTRGGLTLGFLLF